MLRAIGIGTLIALFASASPRTAAAQAQAVNGNIEGTVRDTSAARAAGRDRHRDERRYRHDALDADVDRRRLPPAAAAARPLQGNGRAAGLQDLRASGADPLRWSDRRRERRDERRQSVRDHHGLGRIAGRPAGQDRSRPDHRRIGDPESPAGLAQSLQLRVPPGQRDGLREQRVRRPAHQRERHADADQLPARWQHEHGKGSRRLAHAARFPKCWCGRSRSSPTALRPKFGQTTGMVYNAITPSGTNDLHGSTSFRFRRNAMSAQPFFLSPTARKPDTEVNDFTATLGGPVVKDRWHYYGAYEYVDRSLITGNQVITVNPTAADLLGITLPADGVIPAHQKVNFLFGKTDYQLNAANRLSGRYFFFKNLSPVEYRRRPDDDRSRHRLHGPDGLGVRAAGVEHRIDEAERGPRAVRAPPSVPNARGKRRGRAGDHRERRGQLRRATHRRRQLGRVRLHAGDLAGHRQPDVDSRQPQLQGRASTRSSSPTIASGASAFSTRSPRRPRIWRHESGANPFGYVNRCSRTSAICTSTTIRRSTGSSSRTTGSSTRT